nr:hypothetical protein [Tanacetum cinerariifolium]
MPSTSVLQQEQLRQHRKVMVKII